MVCAVTNRRCHVGRYLNRPRIEANNPPKLPAGGWPERDPLFAPDSRALYNVHPLLRFRADVRSILLEGASYRFGAVAEQALLYIRLLKNAYDVGTNQIDNRPRGSSGRDDSEVIRPGLDFAKAISCFTDLTGRDGCETSMLGIDTI